MTPTPVSLRVSSYKKGTSKQRLRQYAPVTQCWAGQSLQRDGTDSPSSQSQPV